MYIDIEYMMDPIQYRGGLNNSFQLKTLVHWRHRSWAPIAEIVIRVRDSQNTGGGDREKNRIYIDLDFRDWSEQQNFKKLFTDKDVKESTRYENGLEIIKDFDFTLTEENKEEAVIKFKEMLIDLWNKFIELFENNVVGL